LSDYVLGELTGTETATMLYSNMPMHTHLANAVTQSGSTALPGGNYFSEVKTGSGPHGSVDFFYNAGPANTPLHPASISPAGGSQPVGIIQPELCLTAMIALAGLFPARN
jgi:microcystin-dependent protein